MGLNLKNGLELGKKMISGSEQIVKESKNKYHLILEEIDELISILNEKFEYEYINEKIHKKLLGYKKLNLLSKPFLEFIHPNDVKKVFKLLRRASKVFKEAQEIRIKNLFGKYLWVELKAKKFEENHNQIKILVILKEVTKHKDLENKLKKAEKQIKQLSKSFPEIRFWNIFNPKEYQEAIHSSNDMLYNVIENIPHYIFWKDINLRYLGCNNNYARFIGVKYPEDIIKKTDNDLLISKEIVQELHEHELRVITSDIAEFHFEQRWEQENGSELWLDINRIPLHDSRNNVLGILVTYDDITYRKIAEQKIRESEKRFRNLNKIKSELLTRASHELNTPLMTIKGFTELLLLKYKYSFDIQELFLVNRIKKGCNRLETLIKDVLKTAELKSGSIEMNMTKGDLSSIIKSCVKELKTFADSRNHTIKLVLDDNILSNFDIEYIQQVLNYLITNAIKYTPSNGIITIQSQIKNNFIIISIKDTGIGFTHNELKQLFKRFGKIERYGQGFDVISEGFGLGLYITKKIIELHNGEIWVNSEGRNKGSTFYFTLPITS